MSDWGDYLRLVCIARHKGFNLFKPCKTPPSPSPTRRRTCGPAPCTLGTQRKLLLAVYNHLINSRVCVLPEMLQPVRKSALITFRSGVPMKQMLEVDQVQTKRKDFQVTGQICWINQSKQESAMRRRVAFKAVKKKKWSKTVQMVPF